MTYYNDNTEEKASWDNKLNNLKWVVIAMSIGYVLISVDRDRNARREDVLRQYNQCVQESLKTLPTGTDIVQHCKILNGV